MGAVVGALAAGAGMSLAGKLFGKPKQGPDQTSTQTYQMAPWEEDYWKNMTGRAQQLANVPYQAYQGQRVADLTSPQQAGIDNAVKTANNWQVPFNAAEGAYGEALTPFSQEGLQQYMSPFTNDVVSNIEREGNENFSAPGGVADTIRSDFTGLGQFGSKRMGDVMNRAGELNQRETMGAVSNALESGFNQAEGMYNADKNRALSGAGGLSALAGQEQALNTGTTNSLLGVGALEQQNEQQKLNVPYQNYVEARDWDMNRLQQAAQIGKGMPGEGTTTGTKPGPYMPSDLQNFMGGVGMYMGMGANGMIPSFSPSTSYEPAPFYGVGGAPYRKGGLAHYKKGGFIARAIKHPGALHRELGVPQGQRIPQKMLHAAAGKGGLLGRRARFAETLEGLHHAKGGKVVAFRQRPVATKRGGLDAIAA